MTKPKERSELEYLRAENRKLKSENRHLKKLLGRTNKKVKAYEENIDLSEPEIVNTIQLICNCPNDGCGGSLDSTDLGMKTLITCSDCSYRKTIKNGQKV